jgi:cell division protein DivIC
VQFHNICVMKFSWKKIWIAIYRFVKNKYLFTVVFFIVWVMFFDTYNLIDRSRNLKELRQLRDDKLFFSQELDLYKEQLNELFSTREQLEKFAREQYLMKRENEDVFVIIATED